MNPNFFLSGGIIRCLQCLAKSKRTGQQCHAAAMKGKRVCRAHGGLSTGPRTPEGRARCGRRVHGNSTRKARDQLSHELQLLAQIESVAVIAGIIPTGSPGRKPGWRKST
jgi:hypothetical protein